MGLRPVRSRRTGGPDGDLMGVSVTVAVWVTFPVDGLGTRGDTPTPRGSVGPQGLVLRRCTFDTVKSTRYRFCDNGYWVKQFLYGSDVNDEDNNVVLSAWRNDNLYSTVFR
ncbi:hypothetical protein OSB04_024959 [Centaurea solstitialis]|uniref:Uncharacterized protein n=1 Tax=Centaurea solstitialis TaxID=347529 RepID=A0AA38W3K7_9ASTR|nr:hypothetical protein OSB04_024959 [Centaurea solstitialis]